VLGRMSWVTRAMGQLSDGSLEMEPSDWPTVSSAPST